MERKTLPKIKDIMISPVVTIDAEKTIHEAAKIMGEKRIGSVVITKDLKPVGIFTERDLLTKAIANGIDLKNTRVETCMSSPLITVDEETSLRDAIILMAQPRHNAFSHHRRRRIGWNRYRNGDLQLPVTVHGVSPLD